MAFQTLKDQWIVLLGRDPSDLDCLRSDVASVGLLWGIETTQMDTVPFLIQLGLKPPVTQDDTSGPLSPGIRVVK
jgi:hypothetical protein